MFFDTVFIGFASVYNIETVFVVSLIALLPPSLEMCCCFSMFCLLREYPNDGFQSIR